VREEVEKKEAGIEEGSKVEKKKGKVGELEDISNSLMREWQVTLMSEGSKCMILMARAISPRYQMQGIGFALIRWGTRIRRGCIVRFAYRQLAGWRAFGKVGFGEVGMYLDEFAEEMTPRHRERMAVGSMCLSICNVTQVIGLRCGARNDERERDIVNAAFCIDNISVKARTQRSTSEAK
jgi:hypothetical protein